MILFDPINTRVDRRQEGILFNSKPSFWVQNKYSSKVLIEFSYDRWNKKSNLDQWALSVRKVIRRKLPSLFVTYGRGLYWNLIKKNIADDNNIACILIFRVLRKACLDLHL